jgi:hypothetical protein
MAIHLKTNLQSTLLNPIVQPDHFAGKALKLESAQKLVGGYVQNVSLKKPFLFNGVIYTALLMNEEGKFSGAEFNKLATEIAKKDNSIHHGDIVVGDAILIEEGEF